MFFLKLKKFLNNFIIIISFFLLFYSCDKPYDQTIDYQLSNYQVESINAINSFSYSQNDSLLNISIKIKNYDSIDLVYINLKNYDASKYIYKGIILIKVANNSFAEFSNKIKMSKTFSSGKYVIEYFVKEKINSTERKVAEHLFNYDNKQVNYPPLISNLKIPSLVYRGDSFSFSIKVDDPNGLNDIDQVSFKLYRPDGSVVIPNQSTPNIDYFLMVDNGDQNLGDDKANDGIYSFKNSFGQTSAIGNWTFEFQAKDKSGATSNVIKSIVEVR